MKWASSANEKTEKVFSELICIFQIDTSLEQQVVSFSLKELSGLIFQQKTELISSGECFRAYETCP